MSRQASYKDPGGHLKNNHLSLTSKLISSSTLPLYLRIMLWFLPFFISFCIWFIQK